MDIESSGIMYLLWTNLCQGGELLREKNQNIVIDGTVLPEFQMRRGCKHKFYHLHPTKVLHRTFNKTFPLAVTGKFI